MCVCVALPARIYINKIENNKCTGANVSGHGARPQLTRLAS